MIIRALLALSLLAVAPSAAWAMDMKVEGQSIIMSGPVTKSECAALEPLLAANTVKLIILTNSGGGDAAAGYCVGSLIRRHGLSTVIRGRCASSCSRMWLGGVGRTLDGPDSRVGLHGNYNDSGGLLSEAPQRLRTWIPEYAPNVDRELMEQWIRLPSNKWMMYFYNGKAELCGNGTCKPVDGRNALNAGLSTR